MRCNWHSKWSPPICIPSFLRDLSRRFRTFEGINGLKETKEDDEAFGVHPVKFS